MERWIEASAGYVYFVTPAGTRAIFSTEKRGPRDRRLTEARRRQVETTMDEFHQRALAIGASVSLEGKRDYVINTKFGKLFFHARPAETSDYRLWTYGVFEDVERALKGPFWLLNKSSGKWNFTDDTAMFTYLSREGVL